MFNAGLRFEVYHLFLWFTPTRFIGTGMAPLHRDAKWGYHKDVLIAWHEKRIWYVIINKLISVINSNIKNNFQLTDVQQFKK